MITWKKQEKLVSHKISSLTISMNSVAHWNLILGFNNAKHQDTALLCV